MTSDHLLAGVDGVPSMVAIELFAQSAALLMASRDPRGRNVKISGALLGSRQVRVTQPYFAIGSALRIETEEVWSAGPLAQLSGRCFLANVEVASGHINVASGAV